MNPHLGRTFRWVGQRKALPKKTNNVEVIRQSSHDDSEGAIDELTEDSTWGLENCPKSYVKYRAVTTAQSRTTTSTKLRIKELKYGHHIMAQTHGTIRRDS